jgi:hypothetical protein
MTVSSAPSFPGVIAGGPRAARPGVSDPAINVAPRERLA